MGINTEMLDNYDLAGSGNTSYDFTPYDYGDYTGTSFDVSDEVKDFNLDAYFDFDDASWDSGLDEMFSFDDRMDDFYNGREGEEFEPKLYGDEEPVGGTWEDDTAVSSGDEWKGVSEMTKGSTLDSKSTDEKLGSAAAQREAQKEEDDESFWDNFWENEGLLKMMGGIGGAGLGFMGKSKETDMMESIWKDKMALAREDRQHDKDMYDLKMSYKRGTGNGTTSATNRSAALSGLGSSSRRGDFTKR